LTDNFIDDGPTESNAGEIRGGGFLLMLAAPENLFGRRRKDRGMDGRADVADLPA
jgi:hypothetical protein